MEELREELYKLIDKHGVDYEKLIVTDKRFHERIIKEMTKEEQNKIANKILRDIILN